ncbi:MAG: GNAT family N-acetyltransferase [Planctomycetes bacterium]|nr:GNAT family N-acetyltransferase [Planctomycetota bacterium]
MSEARKSVARTAEPIAIETQRFLLRPLTEADATDRYLQWLADENARRFITAASGTNTLETLRHFVRERCGRDDVLFLGIFDRTTGLHIGNIKYEPVDSAKGYAIMGLLIGDAGSRGSGVAGEVLEASAAWLRLHRGIRQIVLGVQKDNVAAIRAYEKAGFKIAVTPHIPNPAGNALTMVRSL